MKFHWLLLAVTVASARAAPDPPDAPDMGAKLTAVLQSEFPYQPAEPDKTSPVPDAAPSQKVVAMPAVIVTASNRDRRLDDKLEEVRLKDNTFTWKKGGTILQKGPVILEIKYDPEFNRLNLLQFVW